MIKILLSFCMWYIVYLQVWFEVDIVIIRITLGGSVVQQVMPVPFIAVHAGNNFNNEQLGGV